LKGVRLGKREEGGKYCASK